MMSSAVMLRDPCRPHPSRRQAEPKQGFVPLAGAYSNPHVQEQITHLARLAEDSAGGF
jgi:hypothetical protein